VALILDAATLQPVTSLKTRPLVPILEILFSPDESRVLTMNGQHELGLWSPTTSEPVSPIHSSIDGIKARFSPDGRWFATWGAKAISLWDSRTGTTVGERISVGGEHVRFSDDGNRVASATDNGNVQVWDVQSGFPVTEPMSTGPRKMVVAEISPDGRFVRAEGYGTPLAFHIWAVPPPLPKNTPTPEWLLQLATVLAAKTVNDAEQCVDLPGAAAQIAEVGRQLATLPDHAPFIEWGRWILNDRTDRSIAPGFTVTPAEAEKLATSTLSGSRANR
jgi:hypothetical protein